MIVEPRESKKILYELCLILERRHLLAKYLFKLIHSDTLSDNVKSKIFGAAEFIIGEALAKILDTKLIANLDEEKVGDLPERYVLWNGRMICDGNVVLFEMSPPGVPDMEYHYNDYCDIVEITLGTHEETILYEIGELLRHKPRVKSSINRRVLVTSLQLRRIAEIEEYMARELNIDKMYLIPLQFLPVLLYEGSKIENILDILSIKNKAQDVCSTVLTDFQHVIGGYEVRNIDNFIKELASQNLRVLSSILITLVKYVRTV